MLLTDQWTLHDYLFWFLFFGTCLSCERVSQSSYPIQIFDDNLKLELIAGSPEIVTPLGIAFDSRDRLFVLESHTHSPPSDYDGPESDRIKLAVDRDSDGVPEGWMIFADGIINGCNLAIDATGKIFVTTKKLILSFEDTDGDDRSDVTDTILRMDLPENVYDHAGLLGITLGADDWIYVSRGNLGSKAWRLTSKSGALLEGYGNGGIVVRCKKDGAQLELVASGFWNPFDIKFTREGRLLLTDNDPDSRGPNRLIEIVRGGDYGFKCLYGGSGLHPYVAWNGELPGTLPYAAPLGEAPCALLDAGYTNFGDAYSGSILVNVWEEKNIVKIPLEKQGSTLFGKAQILVQGDTSFHPVALATDSKGNLYISDWVQRKYPNHGGGKIWRISGPGKGKPQSPAQPTINHLDKRLVDYDHLAKQLLDDDVFERAMLRNEITDESTLSLVRPFFESHDPKLRLEALLVYLKADGQLEKSILTSFLKDSDLSVRKMALIYVGSKMRVDLRDGLENMLTEGYVSQELLAIYLATIQHLQPEFIENFKNRSGLSADKQKHPLPERYIESLVTNSQVSEATRAIALPYLENTFEHGDELIELLEKANDPYWIGQLLHALQPAAGEKVASQFLRIANDSGQSNGIRAQAIAALSNQSIAYCEQLLPLLLLSTDDILQYALIKSMHKCRADEKLTAEVDAFLGRENNPLLSAIWQYDPLAASEENDRIYAQSVDDHGDASRGKLIFESLSAQCQTCHRVDGWGGLIGPDLSNVGASKSKQQLTDAILEPSLEIAPEWQGWYVVDQMGQKHVGRQIDVHEGRAELMNLAGEFDNFKAPREFGVMVNSIMPTGLHRLFSPVEFNDLIAYLESLK